MGKENSFIDKIKTFWDKNVAKSRTGQLIVVLILITVFFTFTEDKFMRPRTYQSMLLQMSELGILAIAVFICILVGGLNVSVTATANLSALMAGFFILRFVEEGMPDGQINLIILAAFGVALVTGFLCGLLNGVIIGYFHLPPLLATIGTSFLYIGIFKGITGGESIFGYPTNLEYIAAGQIFGIPIPFFFFMAMSLIMFFALRFTKFGYKMYMTGANETTAIFSGINTRDVRLKTFTIAGLLSAIPGMIILGRTMSANYDYGVTTYVLFTIFVAVMSGSRAGFGTIINIFIAMFALQSLQTGFNYMLQTVRGNTYFRDFIWGVLLIVFLVINYYTNVRQIEEN
jgi:simple sugar transport system permease protein